MKKLLAASVLCVVPVLVHAVAQEVILLPAKPGKPSEIVYPDRLPPGVEYLIQYDGGESSYELVGLSDADTFGVWFEPPATCTLLAIHFQLVTDPDFEPTPQTYEAFAAYSDQSIDFINDYDEYHSFPCSPGPSPIESFMEGSTTFTADSMGVWGDWDTLLVISQPDLGKDRFFAGFVIGIPDSTPNPRIDASVDPPYHALIWRQSPACGGDPGWYPSWHLFWIRALVKVYQYRDIEIAYYDRLSATYLTTDRVVTAHVFDPYGVPLDSQGVAWVKLHYAVNSGAEDTLDMVLISGDSLDGIYSAAIPGASSHDTVGYYIAAEDYNGTRDISSTHTYIIRKGTSGNILLLIEDDAYYIVHDAVNTVAENVDTWDEDEYGPADSSVLYYYHPSGPGQGIIFWYTWSGFHFADETGFLKSFLDVGGKLFVSSEDIPGGGFGLGFGSWAVPDGHFLKDYMKAEAGYDDYNTDSTFTQYGVSGDTITGATDLSEITVYPYYWAGPGNNWAGRFDQLDPACVPIFYDEVDEVMGYRYEDSGSGYKILWIYWPVHYIVLVNGDVEDNVEAQNTLIARTLDWFGYETGIQEKEFSSKGFLIFQSGPNPFRDRTSIRYELPQNSRVDVVVYNLLGQEVRTLVDREQSAGIHTVIWDTKDNSGRKVSSGPYFLRFAVQPDHTDPSRMRDGGVYTATRKLSVMK